MTFFARTISHYLFAVFLLQTNHDNIIIGSSAFSSLKLPQRFHSPYSVHNNHVITTNVNHPAPIYSSGGGSSARFASTVATIENEQEMMMTTTITHEIPTSGLNVEQENELDDLMTKALERLCYIMETNALGTVQNDAIRKMFQECIDSVEIGESTIPGAGRGLFATKDIPSGTIVAFYPIHSIGCKFPSGVCQSIQMSENPNDMIDVQNSAYALFSLSNRPLCGVDLQQEYNNARLFVDMNPKCTIHEGWYCGYMNDAAIVRYPCDEEYYIKSRGLQNVEIVPFSVAPFQVGVTTRDVKEGEELFVSYGYNYWINNKSLFPLSSEQSVTGDNAAVAPSDIPKSESILRQEEEAAKDLLNTINMVETKYRDASMALQLYFDLLGQFEEEEEEDQDENGIAVENYYKSLQQVRNSRILNIPKKAGEYASLALRRLFGRLFPGKGRVQS